MKKKFRVRKNQEFQSIIKIKKFYTSSSFVLYFQAKKEEQCRVGISVSKKLGNAVVRNKIKRQVRMMCQQLLSFKEDNDIIIIIRKPYLKISYLENKTQLNKIVSKINK